VFSKARYLGLIAVLGLGGTTVATFGLAVAKTIKLFGDLAVGGWREDIAVVSVLKAMDTYLLAVVQLIVAIGLYELFVGVLAVPDWLRVGTLDELKKPIIDVLILFAAIKGIEKVFEASDPLGGLLSAASVAVLILSLTVFRALTSKRGSSEH